VTTTDNATMKAAVRKYGDRVRWFCNAIAENPDSVESIETYPGVIVQEAVYLAQEGPAAYLRYVALVEAQRGTGAIRAIHLADVPAESLLEPGELLSEYLSQWGSHHGQRLGDADVFPTWSQEDTTVFLSFVEQNGSQSSWATVRDRLGVNDEQLVALALAEAMVAWEHELSQ
jgi:hypothetical protein